MTNIRWGLALLTPVWLLWGQANPPTAAEQRAARERRDYIKANYTKTEFLIPMRDGVRLFTSVYTPKNPSEKYPIMLNRTPYTVAPYGALLWSPPALREKRNDGIQDDSRILVTLCSRAPLRKAQVGISCKIT